MVSRRAIATRFDLARCGELHVRRTTTADATTVLKTILRASRGFILMLLGGDGKFTVSQSTLQAVRFSGCAIKFSMGRRRCCWSTGTGEQFYSTPPSHGDSCSAVSGVRAGTENICLAVAKRRKRNTNHEALPEDPRTTNCQQIQSQAARIVEREAAIKERLHKVVARGDGRGGGGGSKQGHFCRGTFRYLPPPIGGPHTGQTLHLQNP